MTYKKPQRNGNTRYGRCKIEDFGGIIETVMWGDEFNKYKDAFVEDEVVIVRGNLERKTDEPILQVTRLLTLEQAQREMASKLHLLFKLGKHRRVDMDVLGRSSRRRRGRARSILTVKDRARQALHPPARPRLPRQPRDVPPRRTRGTARLRRRLQPAVRHLPEPEARAREIGLHQSSLTLPAELLTPSPAPAPPAAPAPARGGPRSTWPPSCV